MNSAINFEQTCYTILAIRIIQNRTFDDARGHWNECSEDVRKTFGNVQDRSEICFFNRIFYKDSLFVTFSFYKF